MHLAAAPLFAAKMIAQEIGGNAAQPTGEAAMLWIERANAADRRQPGFLHDFIGKVVQPRAPPGDVGRQPFERFLIPGLPGTLVAGQDGALKATLPPDTGAEAHAPPRP